MSITLVRDLDSTNGTFLNGRRIQGAAPVGDTDLIQFADVELRLVSQRARAEDFTNVAFNPEQSWSISHMREVLHEGRLNIVFQPIVGGPGRRLYGYEALVRTDVPGLETPASLFQTAARLEMEEVLSQICREKAIEVMQASGLTGALFLNTHPKETLGPNLVALMAGLRDVAKDRPLVLEIHEEAVADIESFRKFTAALRELSILIAFDDFGAGQSRLLELAQAPPDFIKFDRSLVKDLGHPEARHEGLVRSLHEHAVRLGIMTLAEGLETPEAIAACDEIGFTLFQGYAFGRPQPAAAFFADR